MDACEEYAAGLEPSACSIAGAAPRALAPPRIHANHSEYVRGQTVYPLRVRCDGLGSPHPDLDSRQARRLRAAICGSR
jgi:hypothetical protein